MNKKEFGLLVVIVVILALISVIFWFCQKKKNSIPQTVQSSAIASSTVDIANWKTYGSNQLGFSLKYPSSWSVNEDGTVFSLPNDTADVDKGGQPISIPVEVLISTSFYANLSDYQKNIDALAGGNQGSMNYDDLGYEQINGQTFFKDSWMHMAEGLEYVTMVNGQLLDIEFRIDDADRPFSASASYKDFLTFLSSFEVLPR